MDADAEDAAVPVPNVPDDPNMNNPCPGGTVALGGSMCAKCPREHPTDSKQAHDAFIEQNPYRPGGDKDNASIYKSQTSQSNRGKVYCGAEPYIVNSLLYLSCRPQSNFVSPYPYQRLGTSLECFQRGKGIGAGFGAGNGGAGAGAGAAVGANGAGAVVQGANGVGAVAAQGQNGAGVIIRPVAAAVAANGSPVNVRAQAPRRRARIRVIPQSERQLRSRPRN